MRILLLILICHGVSAQNGITTFVRPDGSGNYLPYNFEIHAVTRAGNSYWGVGNQVQSGQNGPPFLEAQIFQTDTSFNVLQTFEIYPNVPNGNTNHALYDIETLDSGKFVVSGYMESTTDYYPYIMALNNNGNVLWQYKLSGGFNTEYHVAVDNLYNIFAYKEDGHTYTIDSSGSLISQTNLDANIVSVCLNQTGLLLGGERSGSGFLMQLNAGGTEVWHVGLNYVPNSVQMSGNGDILTSFQSVAPDSASGVVRLDNTGNVVWSTTFINSSSPSNEFQPRQIVESLSRIIVGGTATIDVPITSYSGPDAHPLALVTLDQNGTILHQRYYRDLSLQNDCSFEGSSDFANLFATHNGAHLFGYTSVACGNTIRAQQPFIISADSNLTTCDFGDLSMPEGIFSVQTTTVSLTLTPGTDTLGSVNHWLVPKIFESKDLCSVLSITDQPLSKEILVYPNPSGGVIFIGGIEHYRTSTDHVMVYDMTGKLCLKAGIGQNNAVDLSLLETGIYTVRIKLGEQLIFRKVSVLR